MHPERHTPHPAILLSGAMASIGILGSHFAGDFFLGIDIMVTSMLVNFLLMCLTVLTLPGRNPALAGRITVFRQRGVQRVIAVSGLAMLTLFLVVHVYRDLNAEVAAWYFHSTYVWLIVMSLATVIYVREFRRLRERGVDTRALFQKLPVE